MSSHVAEQIEDGLVEQAQSVDKVRELLLN